MERWSLSTDGEKSRVETVNSKIGTIAAHGKHRIQLGRVISLPNYRTHSEAYTDSGVNAGAYTSPIFPLPRWRYRTPEMFFANLNSWITRYKYPVGAREQSPTLHQEKHIIRFSNGCLRLFHANKRGSGGVQALLTRGQWECDGSD
jgi:hypothetical protein